MPEAAWPRIAWHRSVFARLVAIMLVMALCLVGMVFGFFAFIVNPDVGASIDRMLGDYARRLAMDAPDPAAARRLAERLDMEIRYEGPAGDWTTDEALPRIRAPREAVGSPWKVTRWGHGRYMVSGPDGGRYVFAWHFPRRTRTAHSRMLMVLLAAMIAVFFTAHFVLSRALRPLRGLQEGVARVGAGDFDVALPNRTRDEFGALTAAFNAMASEVKEMVRTREQLLLDVSHELRSPLTRLKVALALLPDSTRKSQAEADAAEMEAMVTELLELDRLRDGRGLRKTPVDLVALVREAARAYEDGPPGVHVSPEAEEVVVDLDPDGLRTVLRNLIGNAVKYALPDSRPIEVSARREGGAVVVRVVDDGPGIPEADLGSLFEPFFRVDRSRSRKTGGYGLGLSICRRIVEGHGGRLEAANNPGRGACFTMTLPAPPVS